jgi:hypothetical protein
MSDPVTTATAPASSSALPVPVETNALVGYPHITFADLAVISLTAVGVIVAAMAVILGCFSNIWLASNPQISFGASRDCWQGRDGQAFGQSGISRKTSSCG